MTLVVASTFSPEAQMPFVVVAPAVIETSIPTTAPEVGQPTTRAVSISVRSLEISFALNPKSIRRFLC